MHSGLVLNDAVIISHTLKKGSRRATTRREKTDGISISILAKKQSRLRTGVSKKSKNNSDATEFSNLDDFDDGPVDFSGFRDILRY